ncbi:MAG: diguanylate cyclase [Sulfuricurvum sp.]|uniref:diguanylate cyclase domain-containing protein n=1 Tax=Sulfuricurvum sp. TaxID=2025608 RepID=UPI00260E171D|nr:diguanylate cyclase [Sulfuricurvum sp.]MDD2829978.1 diguanylate cyclase [Sulfuricurvum sp.]MDD4949083.1 diguanylate cyclase [Sulfuricurvum sp.]
MRIKFLSTSIILLFFSVSLWADSALITQKKEAVIGVLAFRSKAETLQEWGPLAIYLSNKIPTHHFSIRPLTYAEFNKAAALNELDFMFTNPEHYIFLSSKYEASRMATLIRANVGEKELTQFGGVIIARSNRHDIQTLNDLRDKHIAAVDKFSLGGYLAQRVLLQENGIYISKNSDIQFTDMPHDKVVNLVKNGSADVGFIRTGVLEKMVKQGKIDRNDFKIIHPMGNFPQALSTVLYPEWPFASSKKTDRYLANKVAVALLNLPYGSEITKTAGYYGWSIPLSYEGIRMMMQNLRVPPFDEAPNFTLNDIIQKYAFMIILSMSLTVLLLTFFVFKMGNMTRKLKRESDELEEQIRIRKEGEKYLKRAANVFHNSGEGIVITDAHKVIIDVNESFSFLTGYSSEEVLGKTPKILRSGRHEQFFYLQMDEALNQGKSWRGEIWNKKKSGEEYAEYLRIDTIRNPQGAIENYIGIFSDITEQKKQEDLLHHMANYDPLTNLPNRHLYMTLAQQMLGTAKRQGSKAVVVFLDLDGFKPVNDTYGHEMGDYVLKKVALRLKEQLRQSDAVARVGGDEFVILLSDAYNKGDVHPFLERILKSLKEPFVVNNITITIGASIGAAFYPDDGEDVDMLIRYADMAMYRSKQNGRNQVTYFDQEKMGKEVL